MKLSSIFLVTNCAIAKPNDERFINDELGRLYGHAYMMLMSPPLYDTLYGIRGNHDFILKWENRFERVLAGSFRSTYNRCGDPNA